MSSPERSHSSMRGETRVFLENLPKDIRKDEVDKEFSLYGKIAKIYLIYDPPGSGFVEYFDPGDAEFAATNMNGVEFLGSKLKTKLTRGGIPRGRGSRGSFVPRGRGFSYSYGDRSRGGGYSSDGGGRGSRFRGSSRGMRSSFEPRGRSRGSSYSGGGSRGYSGGSSRGSYNKEYSRGGRFSRGGGRGYSRGEGSGRGFSSRYGGDSYHGGGGYEEEDGMNGYDKYDDYPKYDRFSKDYGEHDSRYSKYSPMDKYSYKSRKDSYHRSRSPPDMSPQGYRSSPSFQRKSRSPLRRTVKNTYYSHNFDESPKKMSPGAREIFRRPSSKSSRNYSSDHSREPYGHSYGQKEYDSSSYGSRRSPMDERY